MKSRTRQPTSSPAMMGVFNSLKVNVAHELAETFTHNCHVCHAAPCTCTFEFVSKFKS